MLIFVSWIFAIHYSFPAGLQRYYCVVVTCNLYINKHGTKLQTDSILH